MQHEKILCVSFDFTVSDYRREALATAGYEVVATTDVKAASRLLEEDHFDLVVIGHRFQTRQKSDLISVAKERENTPVLLICGESADSELAVEGRVYALQGMEGLLTEVAKLLPIATLA